MTDTTLQNPWLDLPTVPPYILPEDLDCIRYHRSLSNLRLDALPDQFVGGLDTAKVVFLALNPGFDEHDITVNLKMSEFLEANRSNRNDPYGSPFYYFGGGLEATGGYKWWAKKLNPLLKAGVTETSLREKIMLIEYFPYHSTTYKHIKSIIPSQQFAFGLVREAIGRNKIIVIMRSERLWLETVPELAIYQYMTLKNKRNVIISPNNMGEENFKTILMQLMAT